MSTARVVLAIAGAVLAAAAWRAHRRAADLQRRFARAAPYLVRSGAPFEEIAPLANAADWVLVATGGNNNQGNTGPYGRCPCQSEYTVNVAFTPINAWPNPAQVAACAANPPPPDPPEWKCAEDCVQVMTHVWHGWDVFRNAKTGQLRFQCNTYAQYHCKKPDDPARDDPPQPTDPGPQA